MCVHQSFVQQGVYIAARKSRLGGLWPWLPEAYFKGPMAESATRFGDDVIAQQQSNTDATSDDVLDHHEFDSDTELEAAAEHSSSTSSSRAHSKSKRRHTA
jgi:hypothetical protein